MWLAVLLNIVSDASCTSNRTAKRHALLWLFGERYELDCRLVCEQAGLSAPAARDVVRRAYHAIATHPRHEHNRIWTAAHLALKRQSEAT
jgi:hypothetical protein